MAAARDGAVGHSKPAPCRVANPTVGDMRFAPPASLESIDAVFTVHTLYYTDSPFSTRGVVDRPARSAQYAQPVH